MKTQEQLESLLAQMTLDEKIGLLHGDGKFSNHGVPRLGIRPLNMNDGPRGIRFEDGRKATCLPCGTSLASTFSRDAAYEYGKLLGEECLATQTDAILGPGMNLMRSPLCARNFEYMGEDPVLSGKLAAQYVRGCQSQGVAACPKHFALNNQETARMIVSSNIDDCTLQELYLRGFETTVHEGNPWLLMCSYNKINGIYASENGHVQQELLKDKWGYDGAVVSDWGAVHSTYGAIMNGMDIEMAGGPNAWLNVPLKKMVERGLVPMSVIDEHVMRVLRLMDRCHCLEGQKKEAGSLCTPEHAKIAKQLAQEGTVLLKNRGNLLPLNPNKLKKVVVTGPSADFKHNIGSFRACGGSGSCHPQYEITPLEALRQILPKETELIYAPGCCFKQVNVIPSSILQTPEGQEGLQASYYAYDAATDKCEDTPFLTRTETDLDILYSTGNDNIALDKTTNETDKRLFIVRMTGCIVPKQSCPITLAILRVRGSRITLKINGETVLTSLNPNYSDIRSSFTFDATANERIPIEIEYCRNTLNNDLGFKLLYKSPRSLDLEAMRDADAILYFGGSCHAFDREPVCGSSLTTPSDIPNLELPEEQNEEIAALASVNSNVVVTLIHGSVLNTTPWFNKIASLLAAWYPGQESGIAIAEMLFGLAEPAGRLCCTWGKSLDDYPCHALELFPGNIDPYVSYTFYLDKEFIGYRHFDTHNVDVQFPFGYGLSYTIFDYSLIDVKIDGHTATAQIKVTNTGERSGSAVVQLYIKGENTATERPIHELGDFAKYKLVPGESAVLTLTADERCFQRYDNTTQSIQFAPATYILEFGTSSRDIFATAKVLIK